LSAEENLSELKLSNSENYLIVFGNEANGISNSISENKNYRKFRINGYSECESLNAAVAAGIVLFEFRK
jgi:tRNA G18 (ribose-2'-O)-methylase SpoU